MVCTVFSDFRGLTLHSLLRKVYARMLEKRVQILFRLQIHEEQFGFCPHQGKLGQFFIFSRLCESIWPTCDLRTLRKHLTTSLWAYCRESCSGVWSGWLAHCYRPFSPCTTISRAVNRTGLIYWICFAFYHGRPNHASLAIRHNTWFLFSCL